MVTAFWSFSATSSFKGKSIAALGEASISGVPPAGLPKRTTLVAGMERPAFAASPLWSIMAKSFMFFAVRASVSCVTVSSTECFEGIEIRPLPEMVLMENSNRMV